MPELSEKISENKKSRGRPRCVAPHLEELYEMAGIGLDCKTRRGKVNRYYAMEALDALNHRPGLDWLFNSDDMRAGVGKVRWTILSELGRLREHDVIAEAAAFVCELKPTTAIAVSLIRRYRIGRSCPGTAFELREKLLAVVRTYQQTHPDMSSEKVLEAFGGAWDEVERAAKKGA
jgi:hypothetical protein